MKDPSATAAQKNGPKCQHFVNQVKASNSAQFWTANRKKGMPLLVKGGGHHNPCSGCLGAIFRAQTTWVLRRSGAM